VKLLGKLSPNQPWIRDRARTPEQRFWEKVDKAPGQGPNGDCWEWQGARIRTGYGALNVAGATVYAHRFALELAYRALGPGMTVDHLCANPPCVRSEHLEEVTRAENARREALRRKAVA